MCLAHQTCRSTSVGSQHALPHLCLLLGTCAVEASQLFAGSPVPCADPSQAVARFRAVPRGKVGSRSPAPRSSGPPGARWGAQRREVLVLVNSLHEMNCHIRDFQSQEQGLKVFGGSIPMCVAQDGTGTSVSEHDDFVGPSQLAVLRMGP